jgi:hypothetical protein
MDQFIQSSDLDTKHALDGMHVRARTQIWTLHHHKLTSVIKIKSNHVQIECEKNNIYENK